MSVIATNMEKYARRLEEKKKPKAVSSVAGNFANGISGEQLSRETGRTSRVAIPLGNGNTIVFI